MIPQEKLSERYLRIHRQLQDLFEKSEDTVARMATVAALLHHKMPHFFWTGFYRVMPEGLVVGPYQGPLACQVLEGKRGVCWAGVIRKESVVVPDVHKFPGHIACDSRSRSEIVIPMIREDRVWGVLDVDSQELAAFSDVDREWLEKIVALI